ncbi:MAG: hypothetical protein ISS70_15260 [Phycisphaerae bacterium]|nr:hypothetical protein [Phycisphaerae bacterium]
MKKNSTAFNLDKKKLRRLLKIGLKSPGAQPRVPDQKKAQLWRDTLSKHPPMDESQIEKLPEILADFCQTLGLLTGDKLEEWLRNQETDLSVIENIKQYAKTLSRKSRTDEEHVIANTLYYTAIAHALLYHKTKITEYSYAELTKAFDKLRKVVWIEDRYILLFTQAWEHCRKKLKGGE